MSARTHLRLQVLIGSCGYGQEAVREALALPDAELEAAVRIAGLLRVQALSLPWLELPFVSPLGTVSLVPWGQRRVGQGFWVGQGHGWELHDTACALRAALLVVGRLGPGAEAREW